MNGISYISAHGGLVPFSGETFVPRGKTVRFICEDGSAAYTISSLAVINGADFITTDDYEAGSLIPNYSLYGHSMEEVQSVLASVSSVTDGEVRIPGFDGLPDRMSLCTGAGWIGTSCTPEAGHHCEGVLAEKWGFGDTLVLLCCRTHVLTQIMTTLCGTQFDTDVGQSGEEYTRFHRLTDEWVRWLTRTDIDDRNVILTFLDFPQGTRALLMTYPRVAERVDAAWNTVTDHPFDIRHSQLPLLEQEIRKYRAAVAGHLDQRLAFATPGAGYTRATTEPTPELTNRGEPTGGGLLRWLTSQARYQDIRIHYARELLPKAPDGGGFSACLEFLGEVISTTSPSDYENLAERQPDLLPAGNAYAVNLNAAFSALCRLYGECCERRQDVEHRTRLKWKEGEPDPERARRNLVEDRKIFSATVRRLCDNDRACQESAAEIREALDDFETVLSGYLDVHLHAVYRRHYLGAHPDEFQID
ncbi:putative adhesin [Kitasatospora mediocidica]|uniref:putative adhesin n=1 Tax=Kitasatospora mediocidica TaxID=58352 RepID=UPI00055FC0A8|nr:hypothetical protein [Kitasatospora mediocidica]